ncbi:glycosyltransferase family 2 protein [Winogradskyella eckloniae]|uniref:glycosyltransferase family 2 protein n=1 Tax=Winogradskyella eckloniae TaxID=1089306 RepID=UPI001563A4C6|nr:glycosyltransferase family 2 protein [Winogradskyella eckloniae]NRD20751.1 glycosyltransferase family 2 protein [Winogradskyella eckloniae]
MNNTPFFSVVIPLYNKEKYISECLKSALDQNFEDYEIVIVNDGSTDQSVTIVESFSSDKIKLFHQKNAGASAARNNGVNFATAKYVAFLDADDIWKNNHLACLKASIELHPNAGLYANNYCIKYNINHVIPAQINIVENAKQPIIIEDFFKASLNDTIVWTSAAAMEKTKFIDYGMFNPIYLSSQDLDLWIRIALKEPIVFNPEITMIYDKSIEGSLGKFEDNAARFILFNSFTAYEKDNLYLKKYLDIKRYGLALRTKINGETKIYKDTLKTLNYNHLNFKQKTLLKTPTFLLQLLNTVRPYIIKSKIYLYLFKS